MIPDTPEDADVLVIQPGQISPGCPTADAVLDRHSGWHQPRSPAPTLSHRTSFAPIVPPTQTPNSRTSLKPGSFILFQLDKQELANRLGISKDSEPLKNSLALPVKQHVGLVLGTFGGGRDSDPQDYIILFVSKTPPPGLAPGCNLFAVPLTTKKQRGDTEDRPSAYARLFPWTGCYQYTVFGARIIPTYTHRSAIEYKLNNFDEIDHLVSGDRAELDSKWFTLTLPMSDEEALLFQNMIPDIADPIPVEVWEELRLADGCYDPSEFVREALRFKELAQVEEEELGCQ